MSSGYHLTFDIDWAPDWSVRDTLDILAQAGAHATFFVTHDSPTIGEISSAGHEIGIHPNFQTSSTQGKDPLEIVGNLLELVPEARAMRTHGLIQGSLLLRDVITAYPQICYDMSVLTYRFPHSGWFNWKLGGACVQRINYVWEDADHDWSEYVPISTVDVLDFHPIHVSLNSRTGNRYQMAKNTLGRRSLLSLERNEVESLRGTAPGTADYLRSALAKAGTALSFEELLCV